MAAQAAQPHDAPPVGLPAWLTRGRVPGICRGGEAP